MSRKGELPSQGNALQSRRRCLTEEGLAGVQYVPVNLAIADADTEQDSFPTKLDCTKPGDYVCSDWLPTGLCSSTQAGVGST